MNKGIFGLPDVSDGFFNDIPFEFFVNFTKIIPTPAPLSFARGTKLGALFICSFRIQPISSQNVNGTFYLRIPSIYAPSFYDPSESVGRGRWINQGTGFYDLTICISSRQTATYSEFSFKRFDSYSELNDTLAGSENDSVSGMLIYELNTP